MILIETAAGTAAALAAAEARKPNMVLIIADDLGYGDLSCYGGAAAARTPHLDALAGSGILFTDAYASAPVCGPSRAGLITGRYQNRFGFEFNGSNELPKDQITMADELHRAGYATGIIGKWHLGSDSGNHPLDRGFDEFYGRLEGMFPYLPQEAGESIRLMRQREMVEDDRYATDAFSEEAVGFIKRHREGPFFLIVSYNAVHYPMQAPPRYLDRSQASPVTDSAKGSRRRIYEAMTTALDDGIGSILRTLRDENLNAQTLVVFMSDNGGPTPETTSSNGMLRGFKKDLWEGGIRVPMIASWPGVIEAGKVGREAITALDWFPTFRDLAGTPRDEKAKLDGVSLVSHLRHQTPLPDRTLFWRFGKQWAVRQGPWKYLRFQDEPARLYDLMNDPSEISDQAAKLPARVAALDQELTRWEEGLVPPLWAVEPKPLAGSRPWPKSETAAGESKD